MLNTAVELAQAFYDALVRGDEEEMVSLLHDEDLEWVPAENSLYGGDFPIIHPESVLKRILRRREQDWDDFTVTPERFVDAGDEAVVLGRYTGTYRANRAALDAEFAHFFEIAGGKICYFREFTDTHQFRKIARG